MVVSFGTSYNDSRIKTIEAIEKTIRDSFSGWRCGRAFTSGVIIRILRKRDSFWVDDVAEAADRLLEAGTKCLLVQPTHVMNGEEFDGMVHALKPYEGRFQAIFVGAPLLSDDRDFEQLAEILAEDTKAYDRQGTEIVFMGHGTEHAANAVYERLALEFAKRGRHRYHVGTVEANPSLEAMIKEVEGTGASRVVLQPLMIVAGDHANHDMAGDEEDSWKCRFQAAGYETVCRVKGLGELMGVRQMFLEHAKKAQQLLTEKNEGRGGAR